MSMTSPGLWIALLIAIILYMVVGVVGAFMLARSGDGFGDDGHWFIGFYWNANEPSLFSPTTFLLRKQLNLGNPLGLLWTIIVILGFTALAVLGALAAR